MSSLDELDPTLDDATTAPVDMLAAIKVEGGRRRLRRHRRNALVAMLGFALFAVPALVLLPDDGDENLTVAADADAASTTIEESTETSAPGTTTTSTTATTVVSPDTTVVAGAPTGAPVAPAPNTRRPAAPGTTAPPATTVPPLVCRNSTDPVCGAFSWDPAPGTNQALSAAFVDAPSEAVVGQEVTFFVGWSDPDADQISDHFSTEGTSVGPPCSVGQRFGPWTPPPAQPGSGTRTFQHTFTSPGVYTVNADVFSGNVCDHPYASEDHIAILITIVEAPPAP